MNSQALRTSSSNVSESVGMFCQPVGPSVSKSSIDLNEGRSFLSES
jgi:hypothetical protein